MQTKNTQILFPLIFCLCIIENLAANVSNSRTLVLSCGSDGGKDADGRNWESDAKHLASSSHSSAATASYQDPTLPSAIPYMSARIFTAESTYKFDLKSKQRYWVRLHFYPASYKGLNISDSYFSVTAGGVTLLNNFSAPITAQALTQSYIMKEYALAPLESDKLDITFKPSDQHRGSFAFVNGIEVIPMPDMFESAKMVGFSDQSLDETTVTLQTMYRLNAGGQYISSTNDSLSRTWYDDTPYTYGAITGVTTEAEKNVTIAYKDIAEYVAPVEVYRTSRTMGSQWKVNQNYNLSWAFQVDANFMYLLRLHFCDYQLEKINQMVFDIIVNNQAAQDAFDVIGFTGSKGVPTYKDYAIFVNDGPGDELLLLSLHPSTSTITFKPQYYDSRLNGLEIFKVSDANKSLAGANPVPSAMLLNAEKPRGFEQAKGYSKKVIGGVTGGAAAVGIVAALCFAVYQRKKRVLGTESHTSSWLPLYGNSHTSASKSTISGKSTTNSHISSKDGGLCRHFTLAEIKLATKNFDDSHVVGVGGFGKVYKGVIDGTTKVAIKRSNPSSEQGVHEFQTEIEMLSKLRHRHLVSLIGFCEEDGEMALVYDYMANGTLREHIYKNNKAQLSWKQRLEICIGAARGLHYLHTGAKYTIIHRDVKTTNILVDENWVAKVSDFGLSKTGPEMNQTHVSTVVKGSFGYLDPEYYRRQQLTEKSDVYSFGVVLFEVLCARPALNPSLAKEQVSLADWALHCIKKGTFNDIIDPNLKGKIKPECLKKFVDTADKCLADHGTDRPSMGDVLWNLEFCLQLQENPDGAKQASEDGSAHSAEYRNMVLHAHNLSLGSEMDGSEESSDNAIFSQIVNPKGR